MTTRRTLRRIFLTTLDCLLLAVVSSVQAQGLNQVETLDVSGVQGGLIVQVGCDSRIPMEWCIANDGYLVHIIDTEMEHVERGRKQFGPLGKVSLDLFDGKRLPYTDGLVNLLITDKLGDVPMSEVLRVLVPGGVALIKRDMEWKKTVKPWPDDIDEWTHYMHDASNNAVAHDRRIGPPNHLQWQSGPRWSRHHDHMASVSAVVSSRGRIFSIVDEGSRVSPQLPSDWKLIARDAFNGTLLWKRSIPSWHTQLWPLKSGPANLPRRLVAEGDRVYATLGIDAPVVVIDAATGKTVGEFSDTAGAEEIVIKDGLMMIVVNRTPVDYDADLADDPQEGKTSDRRTTYSPAMGRIWAGIRSKRWTHGDRVIRAFDAKRYVQKWEQAGRVIPLTLAADAKNAYYHNGESVVALDLATGKRQWTTEPVPVWQGIDGRGTQSWFCPKLVVHDGKVLLAGGEKIHMSYVGWGSKDIGQDTMTAFSADSGKQLWTAEHPYSGYNSPEDLFIARGKVWTGNTAQGGANGRYIGRNLETGKLECEYPPTVNTYWFHHRCYPAKATDRFILSSRTGIELIDLESGQWDINHWIRGGCLYGIMPANGLIYAPPHPCACYPESKLNGFVAVAAKSPSRELPKTIPSEGRLMRGPAYDGPIKNDPTSEMDWPTYRADPARSGSTSDKLPNTLQPVWKESLISKGRLTPPIAAEGRLYLADIEGQTVHAIDAESGMTDWIFRAGGRIDSPPTYWRGRLLFGSAAGYITCLRASDGVLIWRFRAAPIDRRTVVFEQVESLWPVPGSILVQDGVASAVAGRSMFLDGGLRLCRLDVETGRLLSETVLDDRDPATGEDLQTHVRGLNMPVAMPDILASDGERLFMRSQVMDLKGNRPGQAKHDHLFAPYGFTDDSWFHRNYWVYGNGFQGGVGGFGNGKKVPAGRILVNDDKTIFGFGRKPQYYRWSSVIDYQLYAAAKPGVMTKMPKAAASRRRKANTPVNYLWTRDVPMMVRAMALSDSKLIIAGPADSIDEDATFQAFNEPSTQKQLATWDATLKGHNGAMLHILDATTGKTTVEHKLSSPPVFDGLIIANGRIFIATMDGQLTAFGK